MLNDSFRLRYKNIPAAITRQTEFYATPLHNHSEAEVLIIEKGSSKVRIGDEIHSCGRGDVVFINPMEVHSVTVDEGREYTHRCICFDCSMISDEKTAEKLKNGQLSFSGGIIRDNEFFCICDRLYSAIEDESDASFIEAPSYIGLIIAFFYKKGLIKKNTNLSNRDRFCGAVLEYVHGHFFENITSKTAAEHMSFNQNYFCRRFSKSFGMTFSTYLNMYRVSVSRTLLENGKSISDSAYDCGFSSPIYFSKCFKKYIGILPSEYQKSQYSTANRSI